MAVRFVETGGQNYAVALGGGLRTAVTVTCWVKVSVDRDWYTCFWSLDSGSGEQGYLITRDDGTGLSYEDASGLTSPVIQLTPGTWYHTAVVISGSSVTLYVRAEGAGSYTTATGTLAGDVGTDNLVIGDDIWLADPLNGCVAGLKMWYAALSAGEVEAERLQYSAARSSGLVAVYPLLVADPNDYSGNAHDLTPGTPTPATEAGPSGLVWGADTRQNLCPNPACGTNTTGWGGSAGITRSTGLTGMPVATGITVTSGGYVQTPTMTIAPGDVTTVSFYIKNRTGGTIAAGKQVFIGYTRSSGGDTFPENFNTAALGVDGNVQRASFTCLPAPANATGLYLIIDQLLTDVDVTAVQYENPGPLDTYFDGDTPGAVWDGTPDNSTSTLGGGLAVTVWNGTVELPASVTVWDGATEQPASVTEIAP